MCLLQRDLQGLHLHLRAFLWADQEKASAGAAGSAGGPCVLWQRCPCVSDAESASAAQGFSSADSLLQTASVLPGAAQMGMAAAMSNAQPMPVMFAQAVPVTGVSPRAAGAPSFILTTALTRIPIRLAARR
jgi:hypothetical protein